MPDRLFLHSSPPQATDPISYRIPNTATTLRIKLQSYPIAREDMVRTILQTQVKLRRYLVTHYQAANEVLFRSDDPYTSDRGFSGCFFAISHSPPDRQKHLTYGMVVNVLEGLWQFLYQGERFVCADFFVMDDHWGEVGYGSLLPHSPDRKGGNVTEG